MEIKDYRAMNVNDIIINVKESGFTYTQPCRESIRSRKWILEVCDADYKDVCVFSGTKEEMHEVYK